MTQQRQSLAFHEFRCAGRVDEGRACPERGTCLRYTTLLNTHNSLPDPVRLPIPVVEHYCESPLHEMYVSAVVEPEP